MSFSRLLDITPEKKRRSSEGRKPAKAKVKPGTGCENCPANGEFVKVKGLVRIKGRKIMLWAQCPGHNEALQKKELLGPAGKYLWKACAREGINRGDCDIQNVVRCHTVEEGRDRTPNKDE